MDSLIDGVFYIYGTSVQRTALKDSDFPRPIRRVVFKESGGSEYEWDFAGSAWVQISTSGVAHVYVKTQDDLPHTIAYQQKVTARTSTALMTTSDISHIHQGTFTISGLTGETVTVTATRDSVASLPVFMEDTSATRDDGTALGNGTYRFLDLAADVLTFTKSAGTEACTLTFQGYP